MKRMTFIFSGIVMPKTKIIITLLSFIFLCGQASAQLIIEEDFEAFSKNYSNAFYEGSIQGWTSTHGTPDTYSNYIRITPFNGSRYVHLYIEKAGDCSKSPDRGEGIALNHHFEGGYTYKLKYAIRGQVNTAQWILREYPLPSMSSLPKYCKSGEIVPAVQSEDLVLKSHSKVNLENWRVFEVEFSLPANSTFSQLWLRGSNLGVSEKEKRTHLYLDAVSIEKICKEVDCDEILNPEDDIEELNASKALNQALLIPFIYPNPSSNTLTMQLKANGFLSVEIKVFDTKGSIVKSFEKQTLADGFYTNTWEARKELGNGIFFIHFKTNYGTFQRKVVIQDKY